LLDASIAAVGSGANQVTAVTEITALSPKLSPRNMIFDQGLFLPGDNSDNF
jgi:hypothetical protein